MDTDRPILGDVLLMAILLWVSVASLRRIRDIVETQTVSDSGGARLERKDYPIWFWFRLTCVVGGVLAIACVMIATLLLFLLRL